MSTDDDFEALRSFGLGLPEATEDFPWGHTALKVRAKTFAWLDRSEGRLSLTVKLRASRDFALIFDFAEPAGYGLGRSGWISCRFGASEAADLDLLRRWVVESYRAVAPKKLAAVVADQEQARTAFAPVGDYPSGNSRCSGSKRRQPPGPSFSNGRKRDL